MAETKIPGAQVKDASLTDADVHADNKDGAAGTASMRTLGTGAQQACAGNDARLADSRSPTNHASDHTDGTDDIQNATASVKGLATAAQITKLDGIETAADVTDDVNVRAALAAATADIAVNTKKITNVVDPVANQDAATKNYADGVAAGLEIKEQVACATTANITLSGEQTIDGVTTSASRVLVKNQTTKSENGIYVSASGAWSRSTDADADAEVNQGMYCFVNSGNTNVNYGYVLITADPITVGTTDLDFTRFSKPVTLVHETIRYNLLGAFTTGTKMDGVNVMSRSGEITNAWGYIQTAGSSGQILADVNIDGTTIFTTQSNRITIPQTDGDDAKKQSGTIEAGSFSSGGIVSIDIDEDQTGSAADLTIVLEIRYD